MKKDLILNEVVQILPHWVRKYNHDGHEGEAHECGKCALAALDLFPSAIEGVRYQHDVRSFDANERKKYGDEYVTAKAICQKVLFSNGYKTDI